MRIVMGLFVWLTVLLVPGQSQDPLQDPLYYHEFGERLHSYIFRTYTDPSRLSWLLVDSAMDHWSRSPHNWDRSPESYSFRVASALGRRMIRNTMQLGLETALHEDSRYRPSIERRFTKRILFALSHSVLGYKPDGSTEPMYGLMGAGVVAAATSSTWHPQPLNATSIFGGIGQAALDRAGNNLLTEFQPDLRNFGRKAWKSIFDK